MPINESTLTKGQVRKLNALRKSVGDQIAEEAFGKWLANQPAKGTASENDPVAEKLVAALSGLADDKTFCLVVVYRSPRRVDYLIIRITE